MSSSREWFLPSWYRHFTCCPKKRARTVFSSHFPRPKDVSDFLDGVSFMSDSGPSGLIVRNIDPKLIINGSLHHTSKFEGMHRTTDPSLIVRRGQSFILELTLNRPPVPGDGISFIFTAADEERPSSGTSTLIAVPLMPALNARMPWNAVLKNKMENIISVEITSSEESVVSKYSLEIDTKSPDQESFSFAFETPIYILFNPWSTKDQVYLESDNWRDECVLEETGLMWRGTANRIQPTVWHYGQFERDILDCSLYLVRYIGKVSGKQRSDPVLTARALATSVNANDDEGVLVGSWSTDFTGGTAPTQWMSSVEILQKYCKRSTYRPVKYAQCWVFAGVLTTVCRSLGLPCRPVTNFASAHDTQNSLTIDVFANEDGDLVDELNSDSIWNYHIWNEVWMQRLDLGPDYRGWQVIDATPQEPSSKDFKFSVGPSSVMAVKRGEVRSPYDSAFVFSEVNADKLYWKYLGPTKPLKLLRKDVEGVGKFISTKQALKFDRLDITLSYKFAERSKMERDAMLMALKQVEHIFSRYYLNQEFTDIYFELSMKDDIMIGQPFTVALKLKNKSDEKDYHLDVTFHIDVVTYTGRMGGLVKAETRYLELLKRTEQLVELEVTYKEYAKKLLDQAAFRVSTMCKVANTNFEYYAQDEFRVRKPDVKIVIDKAVEDTVGHGTAYVINPLPVALHKAEFRIQAPGLAHSRFKLMRSVEANGGKAAVNFTFVPRFIGRYTVAARFSSIELNDCDGYLNIWVYSK